MQGEAGPNQGQGACSVAADIGQAGVAIDATRGGVGVPGLGWRGDQGTRNNPRWIGESKGGGGRGKGEWWGGGLRRVPSRFFRGGGGGGGGAGIQLSNYSNFGSGSHSTL